MNATQRRHLDDQIARVTRTGRTVTEATIVPATANLLGAHRDVAVILTEGDTDTGPWWYLSCTSTDMFAGSGTGFDNATEALDQYWTITGAHAATQIALF